MTRSRKHKLPPKPLPDTRERVGSVGSGQEAAAEPRPALEKQVLLGYLFLAAGLIFLIVGYLTHRLEEMGIFFNSDTLFPAALYKDLIHRGGSLNDWNLPPPPYFFPEWPLYFADQRACAKSLLGRSGFLCRANRSNLFCAGLVEQTIPGQRQGVLVRRNVAVISLLPVHEKHIVA